jgi:hypothetical protein
MQVSFKWIQSGWALLFIVIPGILSTVFVVFYAFGVTPAVDRTITLGNIVQSFCTVFAAVYVARVINLWSTNRQKEKELLYARFGDVLQQLQRIDDLTTETSYEEVPPLLKKLALRCGSLIECGKASSILDVVEATKEMEQRVKELRALLTYAKATDAESEIVGEDEIRVVKGILYIGTKRHSRISRSVEEFQKWIWTTQIRLARK